MTSFPSAFCFCPFCGGRLGRPQTIDFVQMCTSCGHALYHSSKPAVGVVVVRPPGDAGLLLRRRWAPYRGRWGVPGGFVTYGELPEDAAVREVREETGLEIRPQRLLRMSIEPYRRPEGIDRLLSLYYLAEPVGGREQPGEEATGLAWFTWDALPTRLARHSLLAVLDAARSTLPEHERLARAAPLPTKMR